MTIDLIKAEEGDFIKFSGETPLEAEALAGRTARFLGPVSVEGSFVISGEDLVVEAKCTVPVGFACDRCMKDTKKEIRFRISERYPYRYGDTELDITETVREEFILAVPTKILCSEEEENGSTQG